MHISPATVGVVIIGRNEGNRLVACLDSLVSLIPQVVYVDSGSTDNSLIEAINRGAHTVSLDMTKPFTAARARNAGFDELIKLFPSVEFVQFVDGDCVANPKWILTAYDFLISNAKVAVVCGRRRELYPQKSIYNDLCDHEWNTPIGEAKACGGDAMMRVNVFKFVGGYRASLIAGEEPELCIRIRQAGYTVWRIDAEMTLHDAGMTKLIQWWKRAVRTGYAFAEGAYLHGAAPEFHWVIESRRVLFWGALLPITILTLVLFNWKSGLILLLIYPIQICRLAISVKHSKNWIIAVHLVSSKFPEMLGQIKFYRTLFFGKQSKLIEYK